MDMCVVKVMLGKEKSQKRVIEHFCEQVQEERHRVQTVLRRRVFSRTMLSKVRTAREMQVVGKSKSELMEVIDKLQRVNLNSAVETLITVINVAVSSSVDRQKLLVIVQSRAVGRR